MHLNFKNWKTRTHLVSILLKIRWIDNFQMALSEKFFAVVGEVWQTNYCIWRRIDRLAITFWWKEKQA